MKAMLLVWLPMMVWLTGLLTPLPVQGQASDLQSTFVWAQFTTAMSDLPGNVVHALAAADGLWVGTARGLARLQQGQWQVFTAQNSALPDNRVTRLAATADGVWVGTYEGGLARLQPQQRLPELVAVIGPLKRVTQSQQTFAAVAFDPTYQTEPHWFRYRWVLTREGQPILDEVTRSSVKTVLFETDGHYTLTITAIDRYGYRSDPSSHPFSVELPKPPPPLVRWLQRMGIASGLLSCLYLLLLVPLLPLYPRRSWARTAVNSGLFSKFPLVHKSLLNSAWARRYLFTRLAAASAEAAVPQPYIPQAVYEASAPDGQPLLVDASSTALAHLFHEDRQDPGWRPRALILGRSGSGKSVLLRYLLQAAATRFREGRDAQLPLLLDLRINPLVEGSVEALIRGALRGGGVELPPDVLDFLIHKGHFLLLMDSLNEVPDVTALKTTLHAFLTRDANNGVVLASQLDLLERPDVLRYRLQDVTPEQARTYVATVTGVDVWDRLPREAQMLARNPQDLRLLGEILTGVRPEEIPTRRADLYRELLRRDTALAPWVQSDSGEIRAIYGMALRMVDEGRRVLAEDELAVWVRSQLEAHHIQEAAAGRAVVAAIQRSRMFTQEQERTLVGLGRVVVGFQHELMGKYLAACALLPLVGQPPAERPIDLIALSNESRWFDVLCFCLDRLESHTLLNRFLTEILENQTSVGRRLVAYAIETKPADAIDSDVREAYLVARVRADLHDTLAA